MCGVSAVGSRQLLGCFTAYLLPRLHLHDFNRGYLLQTLGLTVVGHLREHYGVNIVDHFHMTPEGYIGWQSEADRLCSFIMPGSPAGKHPPHVAS